MATFFFKKKTYYRQATRRERMRNAESARAAAAIYDSPLVRVEAEVLENACLNMSAGSSSPDVTLPPQVVDSTMDGSVQIKQEPLDVEEVEGPPPKRSCVYEFM